LRRAAARARRIRDLDGAARVRIIETGQALTPAKNELAHAEWLESGSGWSGRIAQTI